MVDLRRGDPERVEVSAPDPALVTLDALAAAAEELGPEWIESHRALDLPLILPDGRVEPTVAPTAEVIRGIADAGADAWVMVRGLGNLERFRPLTRRLGGVLQLAARVAGETPTATDLVAFVAADGARVPFHLDTGHHVLCQVTGTKTVAFGWYDDPEVRRAVLADAVARHRTNPDRMPDRTTEMVLRPGDAVVIPAGCVHGVVGCVGPSVALTVVLRTDVTEARAAAAGPAGGEHPPDGDPE